MKSFSIISVLLVLFIGWIFIGSTPHNRIERFCQPVMWMGNIGESILLLVGSDSKNTVTKYTSELDYGCRYATWRLFYGQEFEEEQKRKKDKSRGVVNSNEPEDDGIIM